MRERRRVDDLLTKQSTTTTREIPLGMMLRFEILSLLFRLVLFRAFFKPQRKRRENDEKDDDSFFSLSLDFLSALLRALCLSLKVQKHVLLSRKESGPFATLNIRA